MKDWAIISALRRELHLDSRDEAMQATVRSEKWEDVTARCEFCEFFLSNNKQDTCTLLNAWIRRDGRCGRFDRLREVKK